MRLQNEEKNFEFHASGEGKPMKLLCQKRGYILKNSRVPLVTGVNWGQPELVYRPPIIDDPTMCPQQYINNFVRC